MDAGAWSEILFMRTVKPELVCPNILLYGGTTTLVHQFSWIVTDKRNGFQCRPLSSFLINSNIIGRNTRSDCHMQWPYIRAKSRHWIVLLLIWERVRELLDWILSCYQEFDIFDIWLSYNAGTTVFKRSENRRVCRHERFKKLGWQSWPGVLNIWQLIEITYT